MCFDQSVPMLIPSARLFNPYLKWDPTHNLDKSLFIFRNVSNILNIFKKYCYEMSINN